METNSVSNRLVLLVLAWVLAFGLVECSVTYDRKAIVINGQRRILISGSIHYPRSTPEMWEDLIRKAKRGGLDVIETYVFWNVHEPTPGNYNFEGRYDLVRFVKTIQKEGLYAHLRIGPYVCAEWNFGGFPVWLKYVPGISFRTDNEPFKRAMQGFVEKVVSLMQSNNLFEPQGGPIILSQIENEYGALSKRNGLAGYNYMTWAANMAVGLHTGVPWVMCKEEDAPDPVINTCNGFYCDKFKPNTAYKPTVWTEAWSGWFTEFGGPLHQRPVQDLAFAVAKFIQKGGSFVNYYMYHGGTNFGRTAGGPFITTSYDYDAPIDEYGLIREPKYSHLKELHRAIKMCEPALVAADPIVTDLGAYQQAYVYASERGACAAFLSNYDTKLPAKVQFNNMHYNLPPWSISILPDCRNVVFNTARVGAQTTQMEMLPTDVKLLMWDCFYEDVSSQEDSSAFTTPGLLEQLNVTRDASDYLWHTTSVEISPSESFLHRGELPTLIVQSTAHILHVFVNRIYAGTAQGTWENRRFTFMSKVNLHAGSNTITLLAILMGLDYVGPNYESRSASFGAVALHGLDQGEMDLSSRHWTYQVGLRGEAMALANPDRVSSAEWMQTSLVEQKAQPLTWYKTTFDAPEGDEPLALDMISMGKGEVWINGQSIGRYWTARAVGNCNSCPYCGTYKPYNKCQSGCGQPTQRWYHVPRSWLKPTQNLLVIFDEIGGNPQGITLVRRSVMGLCAEVFENHPVAVRNWQTQSYVQKEDSPPKLRLRCSLGQVISSIKFASYGTPLGTCGSYEKGNCDASISTKVIEQNCLRKNWCTTLITNSRFGPDPCPNVLKRLAAEVVCSPATSTTARPNGRG